MADAATLRRWAFGGLTAAWVAATVLLTTTVPAAAGPDDPAPNTDQVAAQPTTTPDLVTEPPSGFDDVDAWLRYRAYLRAPALPLEARVLYRRGLAAYSKGAREDALRMVNGAAELDPSFLRAPWTLVKWQVFKDPTAAGVAGARIVKLVRDDFVTQWSLASNAAALLAQAFVLAVLLVGVFVVVGHQDELRHAAYERIRRWASHGTSTIGSWVLLIAPYLLIGPALPTVMFLTLLWPLLVLRERIATVALAVVLIATPFVSVGFDRLSLPMRTTDEPLAALIPLETDPHSETLRGNMESIARSHGDDPYVQFGLGWAAQHAGDWNGAEAAYRATLSRWPDDGRSLNNLGSALVLQGRREEAVEQYERGVQVEPQNATAYFNLAQAYNQGYEFAKAGAAMTRASALDFDKVREFKQQPAHAGSLLPVPDWITARRQWMALLEPRPLAADHLPPSWRGRPETSSGFSLVVVLAAVIGITIGTLLQRGLPLHKCGNCQRVVCRRCAERRRSQTLCKACARVARGAASVDFARILLARQRQRSTRLGQVASLAMAWLIPGAGLVMSRRLARPFVLLFGVAMAVSVASMSPWPYAGRARVGWEGPAVPWVALAGMALLFAVSLVWTTNERRAQRRKAALAEAAARPVRRPRVAEDGAARREAA